MTISVTIEGRNAGLDGLGGHIDGGVVDSYIRFYDGALPTNVATALAGNNLIVESTMSATAFATAASGAMSANAIPQVVIAASGTITFFRIFNGSDVEVVQGSAGDVGTEDCVIDESTVVAGGNFSVTSLIISQAIS
tara:strand:+ start:60 stop:470 length:411 start_codon:yes stop_codon:yes gene_type:complete